MLQNRNNIFHVYYEALFRYLSCGIRICFDVCIGLQENPSEEDAAVVDKIMASRVVKKEVTCAIYF